MIPVLSVVRGVLPVLSLGVVLTLAGCSDPTSSGPVELRVRNSSDHVMSDVRVGLPYAGGDLRLGDLAPGEATAYREVDRAYRYAAVRVVVDGDTLGLMPIDYVGETPLEGGKHTYRLGLVDGRSLTLSLE